jgi:hypothetical protein
MATFTATVYQNEYLPDGADDVHAVATITCTGAGAAGSAGDVGEVLIIDSSGSMGTPMTKIRAARQAGQVALDEIADGTYVAIVAGNETARLLWPNPSRGMAMTRLDADTRADAQRAVAGLQPGGGTAIGSWLTLTERVFASVPTLTQRHAVLLTDGKNEGEQPWQLQGAIDAVRDRFQCDCRGVGADWNVSELRSIASALLGSVELIADPAGMEADFEALMRQAMSRGVPDARVRVWTPKGASVLFVRQVAPSIEDLTSRAVAVSEQIVEFPTGAWSDESRDFHVAVQVPPQPLGQERLAARVQLVVNGEIAAQGLVKAIWTDDSGLTTRIDPAVAHYTGQTELAQAIQEGLAAKASGDDDTATAKLGRAVQLAAATGNEDATSRLRKVVEVDDADTGTVRLRRDASKLDEMALDTASTKTTRVK